MANCGVCAAESLKRFDCDGCELQICVPCSGVSPTEVRVLELRGSRVLKFFCERCTDRLSTTSIESPRVNPDNGILDRFETVDREISNVKNAVHVVLNKIEELKEAKITSGAVVIDEGVRSSEHRAVGKGSVTFVGDDQCKQLSEDMANYWADQGYREITFPGATTSEVLSGIQRIKEDFGRGDHVVVLIGGNDTNPNEIIYGARRIIDELSDVNLYLVPVIRNRSLNERMLNDMLKICIGRGRGVQLVDELPNTRLMASIAFTVDCGIYDNEYLTMRNGPRVGNTIPKITNIPEDKDMSSSAVPVKVRQATIDECFRKQFFRNRKQC